VKLESTAQAVQVEWSHPNSLKTQEKKALFYTLEYGIGIKVGGKE